MYVMADRIRQARRMRRLSQTELAEAVDVQRSAVAQWERLGGTHPSVQHLVQIAVATKVAFEWLATGRGAVSSELGATPADAPTEQTNSFNFARNELEKKTLKLIRKLSPKRRSAAYQLLRVMLE